MTALMTLIALTCSGNPTLATKPDCQAYLKSCVEWVVAQPESKERDIHELTVASYLNQDRTAHFKICR